jgi:hypothetical protein
MVLSQLAHFLIQQAVYLRRPGLAILLRKEHCANCLGRHVKEIIDSPLYFLQSVLYLARKELTSAKVLERYQKHHRRPARFHVRRPVNPVAAAK